MPKIMSWESSCADKAVEAGVEGVGLWLAGCPLVLDEIGGRKVEQVEVVAFEETRTGLDAVHAGFGIVNAGVFSAD